MPEVPDTVDDAIAPLVSPSTDEVFEATRPFSAREIGSAAVSEALSGGGGGSDLVLADPGNVWVANTAVVEGYRIGHVHDGNTHVFEAQSAGTTADGITFDDLPPNYAPSALTPDDWDAEAWKHLGIVGDVSWEVLSAFDGFTLLDAARIIWGASLADTAGLGLRLISPATRDDGAHVFRLFINGLGSPLLYVDSGGSFELQLGTSGSFGLSSDNAGGFGADFLQVNPDVLSVFTSIFGRKFQVEWDGGAILMPGLPTGDPHRAGQLWNDLGDLKVSLG